MMTVLRRLGWRLGLHPVPRGRGILILGAGDHPQFDTLIAQLHAAHPRVNLFEVASAPGRTTGAIAIAGPLAWPPVVRRYLRRLKIQAILVEGATDGWEPLLATARDLGIGIVCLDGAGLLERLAPMLVSERAPGKVANTLEARLVDALRRPLLGRIASRKFSPIESLPALRERLAHPARILCLGNGPSSEDPALREIEYDALFRVNHSWLDRPHHNAPDVIFTGKRDTLEAYRAPTIFGLQTEAAAGRIVLRSLLLARRFTYFTAERLGCMDFAYFAPYKPTNGAVMIATAAALATQQLIVAGIDLFSDPRGSYPGDAATPNAYTVAHDRELEARFVLETMAAFRGEVIVVGDVLAARWQHHRLGPSIASDRA